jgi:hypothetical protein
VVSSSVSSPVEIRWSRAVTTLLAGLLAVLAVSAAGYGAAAVLSQTSDAAGAVCGSAWRFHTGAGTQVPAGDMKPAQRAAVSEQCARSGDADWNRGLRWGWVGLWAGLAAVALALASRFVSGPGAPRARTGGLRRV